jgi:hypothetical protein
MRQGLTYINTFLSPYPDSADCQVLLTDRLLPNKKAGIGQARSTGVVEKYGYLKEVSYETRDPGKVHVFDTPQNLYPEAP